MKKWLLVFPLLFATLACDFNVTTITPVANVPTAISPSESTPILPEETIAATLEPEWGFVKGNLSYPSEFIPPMRVALFSLVDGKVYYVDTAKNQGTYSLSVPPGTYYVVSYPHEGIPGESGVVIEFTPTVGSFAGGYTQMVPCGLAYGCDDHTLIPVTVESGQTAEADPGDWYAPEGTYPQMPTQ